MFCQIGSFLCGQTGEEKVKEIQLQIDGVSPIIERAIQIAQHSGLDGVEDACTMLV